jgi:hypothetical protein
VHRKLRVSRPERFLTIVETFVGGNMGKNYDFSLSSYLF